MKPEREELCKKIRSIYPDIGACGIDVEVAWDEDTRSWIVDLKNDDQELMTHLEPDDVKNCMEGKECVHLGLQIAQLKENIDKRPAD
jgi:hypothetical protein